MASSVRPFPGPAVITAVLAVVLLLQAATSPVLAYSVGAGVAGVAAATSATVMLRGDVFEARLAAVTVSSASGLVAGLTMLLGAPGEAPARATAGTALVLACAISLPVLLAHRARGRRRPATGPYPQGP